MTQVEIIMNHLNVYKSISSIEAIKHYGITRLASIIHKLRTSNWCIESERVTGTSCVLYRLEGK